MEDGPKTELTGNKTQGDWIHGKDGPSGVVKGEQKDNRFLYPDADSVVVRQQTIDRRSALGTFAAFGVYAAAKLGLFHRAGELLKKSPEDVKKTTDAQNEAFVLLQTPQQESIVEGLVVRGTIDRNGRLVHVDLRDRPTSRNSQSVADEEPYAGKTIGEVKVGARFAKGLLVDGTNPNLGGVRMTHHGWVFVTPETGVGGFVPMDVFESNQKLSHANPAKLKSFDNPE